MELGLLVDNQIEHNLNSSVMTSFNKSHAILERAVRFMNILVIADIVALINE